MERKTDKYSTRDVRFSIKALEETGEFEGLASTYGNIDQGGDVVERGAFAKTIKERGSEVPILWQHDSGRSIGLGMVEDSAKGLVLKGKLELDLPDAQQAYVRLKKGLVKGLSIGFKTMKDRVENGIRHITEAKLFEVSLVTFPMNELAQVTAVKADDAPETKVDFLTALDAIETWAGRYMKTDALMQSLASIVWDSNLTPEERVAQSGDAIEQFRENYLNYLPKFIELMEGGLKAGPPRETKEGRTISKATRSKIEAAIESLRSLPQLPRLSAVISDLQALLDEEAAEKGTSPDNGAAAPSNEPDQIHSWLSSLSEKLTKELESC